MKSKFSLEVDAKKFVSACEELAKASGKDMFQITVVGAGEFASSAAMLTPPKPLRRKIKASVFKRNVDALYTFWRGGKINKEVKKEAEAKTFKPSVAGDRMEYRVVRRVKSSQGPYIQQTRERTAENFSAKRQIWLYDTYREAKNSPRRQIVYRGVARAGWRVAGMMAGAEMSPSAWQNFENTYRMPIGSARKDFADLFEPSITLTNSVRGIQRMIQVTSLVGRSLASAAKRMQILAKVSAEKLEARFNPKFQEEVPF